ncbi:MAG: HIT family protein [Caldilineaceae bacterium]
MYNHAPEDYLCPFCLLMQSVEHQAVYSRQSDIVYHDKAVTAFIGSHQWPNNHGNVLVVPNEHFENLYDLPIHYATDIQRVVRQLALAMKAVYACAGISTRQHNEPAGSQDVWHYHIHVTPRYQNDQFYTTQRALMAVDERASHAARIRNYLVQYMENEANMHAHRTG